MLRLIVLLLLKNCLWVARSPKGYQGGIPAPICSHMGADFPGWLALETPLEPPETLSRALLDPLGRLESLSPCLVHGSWSLFPGTWSLVLGPWSLVPGPWVPGPWSLVPCAWIQEHCFAMNMVFWRFGELSAIQAESATRDLHFWSGPRASNEQGTRFFKHLYAHFF